MEEKQSTYEWATNRDGYRVLIRNKHPRIVVEVPDEADEKQLVDALRKAAEFVLKGERIVKEEPREPRCVVCRKGELYAVKIGQLDLSDDGNIVGEICDDECDTSCLHCRQGTCPFRNMRMADGEQVRVREY